MMSQEDRNKIFEMRKEGKTIPQIAKALGVSPHTINYHVGRRKKGLKAAPQKKGIKKKESDTLGEISTGTFSMRSIEYLEMQNKILKGIIHDLTRIQ